MAGQGFLLKSLNFMNGWVLSTNSCRINLVALQIQSPIRTLKVGTRDKLELLKIPTKPKRPMGPYLQFISEKRQTLLKENPNIKITEIVKKLAEDWKTVSSEQKEKYKEKYEKEMESYDKEILKYNSSLSTEQRNALEEASAEKREDRKKRKITKFIKESDKPKRPAGPYLLFLKDKNHDKNISQKDLMAGSKGEWHMLSDAEKKKYKDEYAKENEKYKILLKNWEKKMITEGHKDLVRIKTLQEIEPKPSRILELAKKKSSKE